MNILLDTNIVSEFRKLPTGRADPAVAAWTERQRASLLCLSVVTLVELEIGVRGIARRDPAQADMLREWLDQKVLPSFADRNLSFGLDAARRCASLHVPDHRPEGVAMIAATALAHGMAVATRNVADFEGTGVRVVNPWMTN